MRQVQWPSLIQSVLRVLANGVWHDPPHEFAQIECPACSRAERAKCRILFVPLLSRRSRNVPNHLIRVTLGLCSEQMEHATNLVRKPFVRGLHFLAVQRVIVQVQLKEVALAKVKPAWATHDIHDGSLALQHGTRQKVTAPTPVAVVEGNRPERPQLGWVVFSPGRLPVLNDAPENGPARFRGCQPPRLESELGAPWVQGPSSASFTSLTKSKSRCSFVCHRNLNSSAWVPPRQSV